MSHPVNDEILENLYQDLQDEFGTELLEWSDELIDEEIQLRFEAMSM